MFFSGNLTKLRNAIPGISKNSRKRCFKRESIHLVRNEYFLQLTSIAKSSRFAVIFRELIWMGFYCFSWLCDNLQQRFSQISKML